MAEENNDYEFDCPQYTDFENEPFEEESPFENEDGFFDMNRSSIGVEEIPQSWLKRLQEDSNSTRTKNRRNRQEVSVAATETIPLSTEEQKKYEREEFNRRKKLRLLQVREQEKKLAKRRLERYRKKLARKQRLERKGLTEKDLIKAQEKVRLLSSAYANALDTIGGAHKGAEAELEALVVRNAQEQDQRLQQTDLDEFRYENAVEAQRESKYQSAFYRQEQYSDRRHEVSAKFAKEARNRIREHRQELIRQKKKRLERKGYGSNEQDEIVEGYGSVEIVSGERIQDVSKTKFYTKVVYHAKKEPVREPIWMDTGKETGLTNDPFFNAAIVSDSISSGAELRKSRAQDMQAASRGTDAMKKILAIRNREDIARILEVQKARDRKEKVSSASRTQRKIAKQYTLEKEFERICNISVN